MDFQFYLSTSVKWTTKKHNKINKFYSNVMTSGLFIIIFSFLPGFKYITTVQHPDYRFIHSAW